MFSPGKHIGILGMLFPEAMYYMYTYIYKALPLQKYVSSSEYQNSSPVR